MAQQTIGIGSIANDGTGDTLRSGGDKINDNFTELYAVAGDIDTIHVSSIDGTPVIAAYDEVRIGSSGGKRDVVKNAIWIGGSYPSAGVTSTSTGISNPVSAVTLTNLASVNSHVIDMDDHAGDADFQSTTVHEFKPTASNGRMAMLFLGHATSPDLGIDSLDVDTGQAEWLQDLLAVGFNVFVVPMLAGGDLDSHNTSPDPDADLNYLKFFVEPGVRVLNAFASSYSDVCTFGHSGGGWGCVLLSAVDERVRYTYSNAGSLPLFSTRAITRDWEQHLPGINTAYPTIEAITESSASDSIAAGVIAKVTIDSVVRYYKNDTGSPISLPGTLTDSLIRAAGFIDVFPDIDYHDLYVMCCTDERSLTVNLVSQDSVGFNYVSFASGWDWTSHAKSLAEAMGGNLSVTWYGLLNLHYVYERSRVESLDFCVSYRPAAGPVANQIILPPTDVQVPPLSGVLTDRSGGGNDGQLLAVAPTMAGSAYYYGESASLPDMSGDYTILLGLKWTQRGTIHSPLTIRNGTGNEGQQCIIGCDSSGTGTVKAFVNDGTVESGTGFGDGASHLVAVTRATNAIALYVDSGTAVDTSTKSSTPTSANTRIHIGSNFVSPASPGATQQFHGNPFSLIIFERALTSQELTDWFDDRVLPSGGSAPAAWYPLEEGRSSCDACDVIAGENLTITGSVFDTIATQDKICYTNRHGFFRDTNINGIDLNVPASQATPTKCVAMASPSISASMLTNGTGPYHNGGLQRVDFGSGETWVPRTPRLPDGYARQNAKGDYFHDFRRY